MAIVNGKERIMNLVYYMLDVTQTKANIILEFSLPQRHRKVPRSIATFNKTWGSHRSSLVACKKHYKGDLHMSTDVCTYVCYISYSCVVGRCA